MAQISAGLSFTGPLGKVSAYKRSDSDKTFLRSKGGASKAKIKSHPNFEKTRWLNAEFGGRSRSSKWIMRMLWPQKQLADYNIAGVINALLKPIQALDTVSEYGQRSILLTKNPGLLQGFSLNRKNSVDNIVRQPITWELSKDTLTANINIPELVPGINFYAPGIYPMYSFIASLGVVPDLVYSPHGYLPNPDVDPLYPIIKETSWHPVLSGSAAETLELPWKGSLPFNTVSLQMDEKDEATSARPSLSRSSGGRSTAPLLSSRRCVSKECRVFD